MIIYAGNAKIITTKFGNMMKISMTESDVKTLQENLKDGWVNVDVKKRKEPSKGGMTHYLQINEYVKPQEENNSGISQDSIDNNREKAEEALGPLPF